MNEHKQKMLEHIKELAKHTRAISELWDDSDFDTYERLHVDYPYETDLTELVLKTEKWAETQTIVLKGIDKRI